MDHGKGNHGHQKYRYSMGYDKTKSDGNNPKSSSQLNINLVDNSLLLVREFYENTEPYMGIG